MQSEILLSTSFFPPTWYIARYVQTDRVIIERFENYQKRSYRNRAFIQSDKGPLLISVPLAAGKNNKCPITEVILSADKKWLHTLQQKIKSCYQHAPFYEHYKE